MEFRFETKLTFEDYKALNHALSMTINRKSRIVVRTVLLVCGVLMLLAGAMALFVWIIEEGVEPRAVITPLIVGVVVLVCGGIYIYYACTIDRRMARQSQRAQKGSRVLDQCATLTEEGCQVDCDGASSTYTYPAFIDLLYCRERYFLVIDKSHAIVLPLANLTEGDPAALGPCLEHWMGRPAKEIM